MSLLGWRVTSGEAQAPILKLDEPISFWGGIGDNGEIIDVHHPQHGAVVTGRILVMRSGRGSSSGTYVLAELLRLGAGTGRDHLDRARRYHRHRRARGC